MKKQLIFALTTLVLIGTSCKKEVTCECTTTGTSVYTDSQGYSYSSVNDPTTTTKTYDKVKKSKLKTLCGDNKYSSTSTSNNAGSTNNSTYTSETKCEIK
ncbi:hypothetical protein CNR22_15765 [Sphingobacteriaceae bacterium]|nr:hypothetical protein CNR22_15765 [Sphingobacteriaceae bacterium]